MLQGREAGFQHTNGFFNSDRHGLLRPNHGRSDRFRILLITELSASFSQPERFAVIPWSGAAQSTDYHNPLFFVITCDHFPVDNFRLRSYYVITLNVMLHGS